MPVQGLGVELLGQVLSGHELLALALDGLELEDVVVGDGAG